MALPPGFLEELRARTPIATVVGRRVRLARSGRHWKGNCPFHGEKTPSFYVYDDHYHCFGCGEHGDAIGFVMKCQGAGFMEAVEQLAGEAGMEVPKPTPEAAEAEQRRIDLYTALDEAQASFQRRLFADEGEAGLKYLRQRGLTDETIARFGLGWSGAGRGALTAELAAKGISAELLLQAGLLRVTEDGRKTELFFNRVTFPIRDRRGRTISFGGRTLGDNPPKYVNGPETEIFSKRRTLYGLDLAREGMRGGATLVVVEGYMDVIALHQADFRGAVAPLGTALTAEQLEESWRLDPVPVLCFDGDTAGRRAASRVAEIALPLLAPDRNLRLMRLPAGDDPDTFIRRYGPSLFDDHLKSARLLSKTLYGLIRDSVNPISVEDHAGLRARLEALTRTIRHSQLAAEYRNEIRTQIQEERNRKADKRQRKRGARPQRSGFGSQTAYADVLGPALGIPVPTPSEDAVTIERARLLTAILLRHPGLFPDVEHAYAGLILPPSLDRLRHALQEWGQSGEVLDSACLMSHLQQIGLAAEAAQALSAVPVPLPGCAAVTAMPADAEAGWWHIFGLMNGGRLQEEVAQAERDFVARADASAQSRLIGLARARNELMQTEQDIGA